MVQCLLNRKDKTVTFTDLAFIGIFYTFDYSFYRSINLLNLSKKKYSIQMKEKAFEYYENIV